jgi:cytochrome P450
MYPDAITPTVQKLIEPAAIKPRRKAPGDSLMRCTCLIQHREDPSPEPARTRPERSLEWAYVPHQHLPFGRGGPALAPLDIKFVLAEIVKRSMLSPAHAGTARRVRPGTLLAPSEAIPFILAGRRHHWGE